MTRRASAVRRGGAPTPRPPTPEPAAAPVAPPIPLASGAPALELRGVGKRYLVGEHEVAALRGIDLTVRLGDYVSIMGPSGSGKSTLLHILGALDHPTEGSYRLEGTDLALLAEGDVARVRNRHFGFVFQAYNLFPELDASENVELPLVYAGVAGRERRARARAVLERLGLGARLRHRPHQLSGGEQQRVAIARALVTRPTVVLADEPTGNLPSATGRAILEDFERLNDDGITLLLVTHDPGIGARARRRLRLDDGRIIADSAQADSTKRPREGAEEAARTASGAAPRLT